MRHNRLVWVVLSGKAVALGQVPLAPPVTTPLPAPAELHCEYQVNPLAVGTAMPRFSWEMLEPAGARGEVQSAYRILVASTAAKLESDQGDLWDPGKVNSNATLQVEYAGKALPSMQHAFWKVELWDGGGAASAWSKVGQFSVGLLKPEDWQAKWIAFPNDDADKKTEPSPCFRKDFAISKPVARATMYICGLGQYELTINGQRSGDTVLGPAWTMFSKTCDYDTIDITAQLKQGANALGVMLGNGMYNVAEYKTANNVRLRYSKFAGTMGVPKLLAQLEIEYADGTRERVITDGTWKTTRGPVTFSHAYGGEDYDARLEMAGWDSAGFAGANWQATAEVAGPGNGKPRMEASMAPPIRVAKSFTPVKITHPKDGMWVYDFGQNLCGWPIIHVAGAAGATVKMTPGELLAADGTVSQSSFHGPTWLSYTLKGGGEETWHPRFATLGYRYVAVEGAAPADKSVAAVPQIRAMTSEFIHADVREVGTFASSDDTLNRIHALIDSAILSNTQSVLTDCPHREKLGWLEQSQLMCEAIGMNYDVSALYTKMCRDMRDSQTADGLVPNIAPEYTVFKDNFRDSPEWGAATVIDPWFLYQTYGDQRILREQYGVMKRYVAYLGTKSTDNLLNHGLGDWFDIGPKKPGVSQLTTNSLTSSATYYCDLHIMQQVAEVLHEDADAKQFAILADKVRSAFNAKFFDAATAQYEKGSQTAQSMPVAMGLVDDANRAAVIAKLADVVKDNKYQVTAGDVGFSYVVRTLTDADRGDVMLKMMLQSDGPGYVAQLKKGATSLTESWDASTGSQNHLMLGHGEMWLYRGLGGIRNSDETGVVAFKKFEIVPEVVGDVASTQVTFHSPRGLIVSSWKRERTHLTLNVTVPPNTSAAGANPGRECGIGGGIRQGHQGWSPPPVCNSSALKMAGRPCKSAVALTNSHPLFRADRGGKSVPRLTFLGIALRTSKAAPGQTSMALRNTAVESICEDGHAVAKHIGGDNSGNARGGHGGRCAAGVSRGGGVWLDHARRPRRQGARGNQSQRPRSRQSARGRGNGRTADDRLHRLRHDPTGARLGSEGAVLHHRGPNRAGRWHLLAEIRAGDARHA